MTIGTILLYSRLPPRLPSPHRTDVKILFHFVWFVLFGLISFDFTEEMQFGPNRGDGCNLDVLEGDLVLSGGDWWFGFWAGQISFKFGWWWWWDNHRGGGGWDGTMVVVMLGVGWWPWWEWCWYKFKKCYNLLLILDSWINSEVDPMVNKRCIDCICCNPM